MSTPIAPGSPFAQILDAADLEVRRKGEPVAAPAANRSDLLAVLNRRTAIAAARAEASRAGIDAEQLLDSKTFYEQVTGLDVDDAGFPRRVADLVRQHARPGSAQTAAAQPAQQPGPRQWTDADIAKASPQQITDAINAGLLRDLGYGPRRHRH